MRRRRFLEAAGALAASLALAPSAATGQGPPPRFADMHAHLGFPRGPASLRDAMAEGGMLVIAEKVVPDSLLLRNVGNRLASVREAKPGELRRNFETAFAGRATRAKGEGLLAVTSAEVLDRVVAERVPAIVLASEGADFLEGDLAYLERVRAQGLVHLQLVHSTGPRRSATSQPRIRSTAGSPRSARTWCARATGSASWWTSRTAPGKQWNTRSKSRRNR